MQTFALNNCYVLNLEKVQIEFFKLITYSKNITKHHIKIIKKTILINILLKNIEYNHNSLI